MREVTVSIVGWAHLPFGRLDGRSLEDLIVEAATGALAHAGVPAADIDGIWLGNLNGGFTPDIFAASLVAQADQAMFARKRERRAG